MSYLPSFQTTPAMVNLVAEIVELMSAFDVNPALVPSPTMRKINQLRTVHSSTWIEGNTLTLEEVTDVINGKHVVAPEREVAEVKQAFAAYDFVDGLDPLSLDDLLQAHAVMMAGLTRDAGKLRKVEVGVYSGTRLIHAGIPAAELPAAMEELLGWLRASSDHPLIQGCFFHCAFEGIHPFADGNGRTGRLWHSLINRRWRRELAWIPIESMVADNQREYYHVLNVSNSGDATRFIEFMLEMMRDSCMDIVMRQELGDDYMRNIGNNVGNNMQNVGNNVGNNMQNVGNNVGNNMQNVGNADNTREAVLKLLEEHPTLSAGKLAERLGVTRRQVERILVDLKSSGKIDRVGPPRGGHWVVNS